MASTTSVGESGPVRRTDIPGGLKKTRRHHHTIEEWNARKEQLAQLYLDQGRNLAETILLMRADGFHARYACTLMTVQSQTILCSLFIGVNANTTSLP